MHAKILIAAGFIATLSACAPQQALIRPTASGNAEAVFANTNLDTVRNKLVGACASAGANVEEANSNAVQCAKTMQGQDAVWTQVLVGNSYSTTPVNKLRFTMYQSGPNVNVMAAEWAETQMAFGQTRRMEMKSNNQRNALQQMLYSIGGE